jgi:hypothetical protein
MKPIVRRQIYDTYWKFAAERHAILLRRLAGEPPPWTDDPVLGAYKFCNTYRAADRVTQYLIRHVIYGHGSEQLGPEDTFLRTVLFRIFSKESTWEALEEATGGVTRSTLDVAFLGDVLAGIRKRQPIYTSAFILASPSRYGHTEKHRNHLELVADMFIKDNLGARIARDRSLRQVFQSLIVYPGIGPFLGYQLAIDLNYSGFLDFSENEFSVPGPGCLRGMKKVFPDPGDYSGEQLIQRMVELQHQEFDRLGLDFPGLFGRPLQAIDCQGLFCEVDKYSREYFPRVVSQRSRIKHRYSPENTRFNPAQAHTLFFPPKWGLNSSQ